MSSDIDNKREPFVLKTKLSVIFNVYTCFIISVISGCNKGSPPIIFNSGIWQLLEKTVRSLIILSTEHDFFVDRQDW